MTLDLGDGKNVFLHSHSDRIWLSAYNGQGIVIPMTPAQAQEIGLAMFRLGREMKRAKS